MNRLIFYPTGTYGTFIQWLCNTPNISGPEDLPFHADGNSHRYVLSDQYQLLLSDRDKQEFVDTHNNTVVSGLWPLVRIDHNGRPFNVDSDPNFYFQLSKNSIEYFDQHNVKILALCPTDTSKIWWYHNNYKKVFYTQEMHNKKTKEQWNNIPWLLCTDVVQRVQIHMNYYQSRTWYKILLLKFNCTNIDQLSLGQLRHLMSVALQEEMADYLSNWTQLPAQFPNVKFVSMDQLRDHTKETVLDIFEYFDVKSNLPLDFVLDQWTELQTTRNRDREHINIVNYIVNGQDYDWSNLNFDLFDEVYLYHELKYQHNIILDANNIDCLTTNTRDLLRLAR